MRILYYYNIFTIVFRLFANSTSSIVGNNDDFFVFGFLKMFENFASIVVWTCYYSTSKTHISQKGTTKMIYNTDKELTTQEIKESHFYKLKPEIGVTHCPSGIIVATIEAFVKNQRGE